MATADFGEGHGVASDGGVVFMDVQDGRDRVLGWDDGGKLRKSSHFLSFAFI